MAKKKTGRPTIYSEKIASEICERLMDGESLRAICRSDHLPDLKTIYNWLDKNNEFFQRYAKARDVQADNMVEEILEIADDGTNDYVEKQRVDGSEYIAFDNEHVQRSKLRVDARKWVASKLKPTRYGDKVDVNHGGQSGNPLQIVVSTGIDASPGSKD